MLYVSSSRCRGLVCDCNIALCLSAPLDQISASGPLVVFCCRVAVLYVFSSRCRGLVCDCDIALCLSCPLGSGKPFRSSSCVLLLCGCKCYISFPRGAVAWSVIVAFSCASNVPWDQVSASGPLVAFCCRVAVLYVSSSRCRGLVCDCGIFPCLSCPLGSVEPFRSSSCVLLSCGCKCYMSLPRGAVAWSVIVTFSCASHAPWDQVSPSGPLVVFCCRVAVSVICLFLAVPWLGL